MKNCLKLGILLFGISLSLWNCQNDNEFIEQQSIFQTVSYEEALDFFNSDSESKSFESKSAVYFNPDLNNISQEVISNSEELLTIIPAEIIHKDNYSRILLLKINGKIENVVFTMLPNKNLVSTYYTGIVIITDLSGKFQNGYRIEDGILKTQISINKETSNKYLAEKSSSDGCLEHSEYNGDCYFCTQQLDEVEIIGKSAGYNHIPITGLYNPEAIDQGGGADTGMGWDYGPGEGTSNDDAPDQIINNLTDKADCAYQKLLKTGISNYHNLITELFIEFGEGNIGDNDLTFLMSDDLPPNEGAHTYDHPIEEGHYIIKVNSNLLK